MANGTYRTKTGENVQVTNTGNGHYVIRYADGRVTVI